MLIVALAVASAIGAPLRYLIDGAIQDRIGREFPFGTFVVNLTASIAVGLVTGLALYQGFPETPRDRAGHRRRWRVSTWSTLAYESVRLVEEGSIATALLNVSASLAAGIAAAGIGIAVAAAI